MNTNFEKLNFLYLTNEKLANYYKLSGRSFLPEDFSLTDEKIVERLAFANEDLSKKQPEFLFEDKKVVKKRFKILLKNLKKINKMSIFATNSSKNFQQSMEYYFQALEFVCRSILKEFSKFDFMETGAYEEIVAINPIIFEILRNLFDENFDVEISFSDFEEKYTKIYEKMIKNYRKNKKSNSKSAKNTQIQQLLDENKKIIKNSSKISKKSSEKTLKNDKNTQKLQKTKSEKQISKE